MARRRLDVRLRLVALGLPWLLACGDARTPGPVGGDSPPTPTAEVSDATAKSSDASSPAAAESDPDPGPLAYDPDGPEPADTAQPEAPHRRRAEPLAATIDIVKSLDPTWPGLAGLRALQATAAVPEWSHRRTWDPRAARDDDARTDWRCKSTAPAVCGWMATLPEPARVRAIRIVVGRGKVREFRLHTDAGVATVAPLPNAKPRYIVFDPPVSTATLALEAVRPGSVRLAEVEIYGEDGQARAPWTFDPTSAAVIAAEPWHAFEGSWRLGRYVCLAVLDATVRPRCLFRGTAMYGRRGDRFVLQEAIHATTCTKHAGVYVVVDRATRRRVKATGLSTVPAPIHLHREGRGFATPTGRGAFTAIVAEGDALVETRYDDADALVAAGFDAEPHARGEFSLEAPDACPDGFPFSSTLASETGETGHADDDEGEHEAPSAPSRELPREIAQLPARAREAIVDELEGMCLDGVDQGNFAGTGPDDFLVRMHDCVATDAVSNWLLSATDLGDYLALEVPGVGGGGRPSFDRLADGKRVLLVDDDCCGIHSVAIVVKGRGSVLEIRDRYEAGEGQTLDVERDAKDQIVGVRVEPR